VDVHVSHETASGVAGPPGLAGSVLATRRGGGQYVSIRSVEVLHVMVLRQKYGVQGPVLGGHGAPGGTATVMATRSGGSQRVVRWSVLDVTVLTQRGGTLAPVPGAHGAPGVTATVMATRSGGAQSMSRGSVQVLVVVPDQKARSGVTVKPTVNGDHGAPGNHAVTSLNCGLGKGSRSSKIAVAFVKGPRAIHVHVSVQIVSIIIIIHVYIYIYNCHQFLF
jgi:hypothetical protein